MNSPEGPYLIHASSPVMLAVLHCTGIALHPTRATSHCVAVSHIRSWHCYAPKCRRRSIKLRFGRAVALTSTQTWIWSAAWHSGRLCVRAVAEAVAWLHDVVVPWAFQKTLAASRNDGLSRTPWCHSRTAAAELNLTDYEDLSSSSPEFRCSVSVCPGLSTQRAKQQNLHWRACVASALQGNAIRECFRCVYPCPFQGQRESPPQCFGASNVAGAGKDS